jgi:hypothetical protein
MNWNDRNDAFSLKIYKERKNLKTLLALCFTKSTETYHHWHVFAGDSSGVRIVFNEELLLRCFDKSKSFQYSPVKYYSLEKLRIEPPSVDTLPFIKRVGYSDENEFRVIYKNKSSEIFAKNVPIPIHAIDKIYLNPWMPSGLIESFKDIVCNIVGCERLQTKIVASTLISSMKWKELISEVE